MEIKGKTFLVTGGASGLGAASVRALVDRGASVGILDLNDELGERLAKELGDRAIFSQCDVTSEEDVQKAIDAAVRRWPNQRLGGVVHCGGIAMAGLTLQKDGTPFSLDAFRTTVDVNLVGSFNVCRLVASHIARSYPPPSKPGQLNALDGPADVLPGAVNEDRGVLILTSSVAYQDGQAGQTSYAASKGGVASLVLPLARDLARFGIRANAIAPSLFKTAMSDRTPPKARAALLQATEFPPRLGEAAEFAHLALALIENPMLNGTVIRIDGATRMGKL